MSGVLIAVSRVFSQKKPSQNAMSRRRSRRAGEEQKSIFVKNGKSGKANYLNKSSF
ncbi:MAG: hypothetical protein ACTSRI_16845 [Promethearchaeota archaeon]